MAKTSPGYKVRWRETNETDWREQGRSRKLEANANACSDGNHPEECRGKRTTLKSTDESGASGKTASSSPPQVNTLALDVQRRPRQAERQHSAGQQRASASWKAAVQHEVQVATCTDQSCGAIGAWSASSYAYSR